MWLGVLGAYLLGNFPTAVLVGRRLGLDPRSAGSGNPGASNVYRLLGARAGLAVLVIDAAKGAIPVVVALAVLGRREAHAVWLAAVVGHVWPALGLLWPGARGGGKGVATAGGGGLVLHPLVGLGCVALFAAFVGLARAAAAGSLAVAVAIPIGIALMGGPGVEVLAAALISAILVVRHRPNIEAILSRSRTPGEP